MGGLQPSYSVPVFQVELYSDLPGFYITYKAVYYSILTVKLQYQSISQALYRSTFYLHQCYRKFENADQDMTLEKKKAGPDPTRIKESAEYIIYVYIYT